MKETLFHALSPARETTRAAESEQTITLADAVDRRNFVKFGAAGLGVLAAASTGLATFPRRFSYVPIVEGPPLRELPPPPPEVPIARLTFEVSSGVHPHQMLQMLQAYLAQTLSPDFAGQIVQATAMQRVPGTFHQQYWSDYSMMGQIPPTRTRYGYYLGVNDFARSDAQMAIRPYQDLNYFEMRRLMNGSEVNQYGMVLQPNNYRRQPTQADWDVYVRVARAFYGIQNPDAYQMLYTRTFTNGRGSYNGYLIARGPDLVRSPYKDLLIDNVPA